MDRVPFVGGMPEYTLNDNDPKRLLFFKRISTTTWQTCYIFIYNPTQGQSSIILSSTHCSPNNQMRFRNLVDLSKENGLKPFNLRGNTFWDFD